MIRQPAVANRFYPGDPEELGRMVQSFFPSDSAEKKKALGVVSPHAGYVYSGSMAGRTIGSVEVPRTVIILGPNHTGRGARAAVSTSDWRMPGGVVPCAKNIAKKLIETSPLLTEDESAHKSEHSLEVQVPFLQELQPDLKIVAISLSSLSYEDCVEIGRALARVIDQSSEDILIVASTDMSHYESRASASVKDKKALDKVLTLDAEGLYHTVLQERISMCGFIPVAVMLETALKLGATNAELVGYTDSGAVSGDTDQVVGYAGVVIA
jgi:AmmeMemoRadiSam system protein B